MYLEGNIWGDTGQIQNFIRHGPGKPGLVGSALSRGLELQDVKGPPNPSYSMIAVKNEELIKLMLLSQV